MFIMEPNNLLFGLFFHKAFGCGNFILYFLYAMKIERKLKNIFLGKVCK